MNIRLKVWFEVDGEYVFGDGRAELLRLIEQSGSIKKAASNLRMSYRHAWGQIRKMEDRLGTKLVETYIKLKKRELNMYLSEVSDVDDKYYLHC